MLMMRIYPECNLLIYFNIKHIRYGIDNANLLSNYEFHDFDHNTRKWTKTMFSADDIRKNLLTTEKNESSLSLLNLNDLYKSYSNFKQIYMYDYLTKLELQSENCEFRIFGALGRDARTNN